MRDARGAPRRIRTSDPRFRRPMLYPAELLAHEQFSSGERGIRTRGKFPYTRLAGEHLRPLGQLSTHAYSIVKRRRRDSNPRSLHSAVFKTAAFGHSATPPDREGRRLLRRQGEIYTQRFDACKDPFCGSRNGRTNVYGPTRFGLGPPPRPRRCWARRMSRRIRCSMRGMAMTSLASCPAVMMRRTDWNRWSSLMPPHQRPESRRVPLQNPLHIPVVGVAISFRGSRELQLLHR